MPRAVIITRAHVAVFAAKARETLALTLMARTLAVVIAGLPLTCIASKTVFAMAGSLRLYTRTMARAGQSKSVGGIAVRATLFGTVLTVPRVRTSTRGVLLANTMSRALVLTRLHAARWSIPTVFADALGVDTHALVLSAWRRTRQELTGGSRPASLAGTVRGILVLNALAVTTATRAQALETICSAPALVANTNAIGASACIAPTVVRAPFDSA